MSKMQIYHADREATASNRAQSTAAVRSPFDGVSKATDGTHTAAQVMERSGLNWRVQERRLVTEDGLAIDSHKALLRSDNRMILGVVGNGYEPLQNAEAFSFADSLVDTGRMEYLSAGQFSDGKRIFIQCKLNDKDGGSGLGLTEITPGDTVQPYFLLANGHDGSLAVRVMLTSIRVICQNTFAAAISKDGKKRETSSSIKHTKNLQERLEATKSLFAWAGETFGEFVTTARILTKKQVGGDQILKNFFRTVFDVEGTAEDFSTQIKNREERLLELFQIGHGNSEKSVRGSYWAAANAVTQYLTHESRTAVKGADEKMGPDEKLILQRAKRLESNLFGGNQRIVERTLQMALAS